MLTKERKLRIMNLLEERSFVTIKELIEEGYHYGDMVILLRSGAGRMEPMAEFLEQEEIPVSCDNKTGVDSKRTRRSQFKEC